MKTFVTKTNPTNDKCNTTWDNVSDFNSAPLGKDKNKRCDLK